MRLKMKSADRMGEGGCPVSDPLLKSGVDALFNANKMGLISNAIGAFNDLMGVAPPPPLRHRFVYDSYGRVDVEFIKR